MDDPDRSDALETAIAAHQAGRIAEAEMLYRMIIRENPGDPDALNLLGVIFQDRGEFTRSIDLIAQALQAEPDFPEAWTNLARAQRGAGQPTLAANSARRAMAQDPDQPEAPLILSRALLDLGDSGGAAVAARQAIALNMKSTEAHANLGLALEGLKDWQGAATAYRTVLNQDPARLIDQVRLAAVYSELGQQDAAIPLFRDAHRRAPSELPPMIGLGQALQRAEDIDGSIAALQRALELAPGRADVWRMQGGNFDALGRFGEAADCYDRALQIEPASAETRRSLAKIGRLVNVPDEVARLAEALASESRPAMDRIAAGFALGILHDKAGDHDDAFKAFESANRLAKAYHFASGAKFDARELKNIVDSHIAGFNGAALAIGRLKGDSSEQPVFVVGMPRSGTTLVEQIAASHPRVCGVGETMDMNIIVKRLESRQPGVHPIYWDSAGVRREAEAHLLRLRGIAGDALRVIDKLPDNVLILGHIAMLFPRARVIVCRRDPRDVCLSCFFQQFEDPTPWSLDQVDCAVRAREIIRLMDFWRIVQPLRMLEVNYEDMVADLEGQSRRLIDFLGLDWDPACLDFHKTNRKVMSASQWQVRQPLYSSSVGRWRHYRRHLAPMLSVLADVVGNQPAGV